MPVLELSVKKISLPRRETQANPSSPLSFVLSVTEGTRRWAIGLGLLCSKRILPAVQASGDISFERFVTNVKVCQWLSQKRRVELWLKCALGEDGKVELREMPQSCSIWSCFEVTARPSFCAVA